MSLDDDRQRPSGDDGGEFIQPRVEPAPQKRGGWGAAIGAVGIAILAKLKLVLGALKLLKFGKLLITAGSMIMMIWFEAQRSGWMFGVGFVICLLIHELGHGYAIKRAGLAAGYPVFIPFLGAMISLKGQPRSSLQEAEIALAGPVAGTAAAIVCAALFYLTHQRIWLALAYTGFFLNLFNLVPISPLDGGRVTQMFSRRAWIVGLVMIGGLFFFAHTPQLLIIGIFALMHAFRRQSYTGEDEALVTPAQRRGMAIQYFGLAAFLGLGAYFAHSMLGKL